MKATQIVTIVLLISSIFIANFQLANANNQQIADPAPISDQQPVRNDYPTRLNPNEARVTEHRITPAEVGKLKSEIGVYTEGQDYTEVIAGHGTGLRPPTTEEWQAISEGGQVVDYVSYPSSPSTVDNSQQPWFPPIGNQGAQGSCVTWSVGYYVKTFQEAKEHGWDLSAAYWEGGYTGYPTPSYQDRIISPAFIYNLINNGVDQGSSFTGAIQLVCNIGACSWQKMPYNSANCTIWPSEAAWTEAPLYRGNSTSYHYIYVNTDEGIDNLKNWLASGNLAIIGVDADQYENMTSADVWTTDNYVNPDVNHANTIVGYDDNITYTENGQSRQGAFKVANSWGTGYWEHVNDGFYWISYEAMKQRIANSMVYDDLVGYQPELIATFRIIHNIRSECAIKVGLGTPASPITTKSFSNYIHGGSFPFCSNNIVLDITEFKKTMPTFYNQPFFLEVRDTGTSATGNITKFAIETTDSPDAPRLTINNNYVYLTVTYTQTASALEVSPTSGPAGGAITLNGTAFTASSSANLSWLNPITSTWTTLINSLPTSASGQFIYNLNAPDLLQTIGAGDNSPIFDEIVFRAQDNSNGYACNTAVPYAEWRRGLTRVGDAVATGLYGNGTNLASTAFVEAGQPFVVSGRWFNPGSAAILWDGVTNVGAAVVDETGFFSATVTVPPTSAGAHNIVLRNGDAEFSVAVTRLPATMNDYDGLWHTSDFVINLTPDSSGISGTYYRLNGGPVQSVSANEQPRIIQVGADNTLEYWSVDNFGNEESHKTLTQIKLDKTAPSGSIQINSGANYTTSTSVMLTLTATDSVSGVSQVRFSNDGVWDTEQWENPSTAKTWALTSGDGQKTVYYEIKDNAGLVTSYSSSIILDTEVPVAKTGQDKTVSLGSCATFDAQGCTDDVGVVSYEWDFGDGTTADGITATHVYSSPGTYNAQLTIKDAAGNTATSNILVTVHENIIPEFPSLLILPAFIIGALAIGLIYRKKHQHNNKLTSLCGLK
jgi:hypothetical protein